MIDCDDQGLYSDRLDYYYKDAYYGIFNGLTGFRETTIKNPKTEHEKIIQFFQVPLLFGKVKSTTIKNKTGKILKRHEHSYAWSDYLNELVDYDPKLPPGGQYYPKVFQLFNESSEEKSKKINLNLWGPLFRPYSLVSSLENISGEMKKFNAQEFFYNNDGNLILVKNKYSSEAGDKDYFICTDYSKVKGLENRKPAKKQNRG